MSIKYLGDNKWKITIHKGRKPDGKQDRYYETFHAPRKSLAQAREKELKQFFDKNKYGPRAKVSTIGELLFFWWNNLKDLGIAQERTLETYYGHIKKLLPVVGDIKLYALTAFEIQEALKGQYPDISPRTRKNIYSTLRSALRSGFSWGLTPVDVSTGIKIPKVEIPEKLILDFEQLQLLLEQTKYKHYLIVRMLTVTGARLSEILGLRWTDINFETGEISIIKTVDSRNRKVKDRTKTKASKRRIILDIETLDYLQAKRQSVKIVSLREDERLVFVADDGRPMRHRAVELTLHRMLKSAGLPQIGIHNLRHSVLTNMNDIGISIADIIALSGHADITSLLPYLHQTKTGLNLIDTINKQTNR